jgi:preprotein translocase subunit SecD
MLYFSRWKALSILLTAAIVCAFAAPNFVSPERVKTWPEWAQRYVVLGLDLQGGSHILLQVDTNDVLNQRLDGLRQDAVKTLRDAKIVWANAPARKGNAVEVRLREDDKYQTALAKLRDLAQPITNNIIGVTGQRTLEVTELGGGLVRLAPTEAATNERIRQTIE